jgi:curli biogenesis system outer membrane secretion channel CsgG
MPAVVKAAFNKLDPVFQQNLKPNATIAVFLGSADSLDNADDIYTQLQVNIMNSGRYDLVEKRRVDELLTEHDFQRAGLVADNSLISFGKLLGADAVILSSVTGKEKERQLVLIAVDMANRATLAIAKEKL